ncbi:MAG: ATP-binding protein [Bacteroidota bacterium]
MNNNHTNLFDKYKDFATKLVVCNDLRCLFGTVEKLVNEICDYEYMVLYYYTAHSDRLFAVTTKGLTKEERFLAQKTAMQRSPGRCLRTKEIIYIKEADSEAYELQNKFVIPTLLNSRLYIPLINNGQVLGVYSLASVKTDNFSEEVINAISFITNIAAVIYKKIIETRDLERMNKRLEEINRNFLSQKLQSIGQLAAGIAHEINTPLQYINDNLDFLEHSYEALSNFASSIYELIDDLGVDNWNDARNIIKKNIKETDIDFFFTEIPGAISQSQEGILKISKIINTIKNFSQVGVREKSFLNINRTLEDIVLITRNEWKKIAEVNLSLHSELPVIYCYADEVNQVLLQFLLNSIDAIKEKMQIDNNYSFGKIEISTCFGDREIAVQFVDDGIGIQERHLDKIFDPFFTTKPPGKGTGQGLAIAHNVICSKLGGDIFVSSNYLKGTEFIIKLPYD